MGLFVLQGILGVVLKSACHCYRLWRQSTAWHALKTPHLLYFFWKRGKRLRLSCCKLPAIAFSDWILIPIGHLKQCGEGPLAFWYRDTWFSWFSKLKGIIILTFLISHLFVFLGNGEIFAEMAEHWTSKCEKPKLGKLGKAQAWHRCNPKK